VDAQCRYQQHRFPQISYSFPVMLFIFRASTDCSAARPDASGKRQLACVAHRTDVLGSHSSAAQPALVQRNNAAISPRVISRRNRRNSNAAGMSCACSHCGLLQCAVTL
jgi:hypothetical protein